jgi:hypothetical protein
MTEEEKCAWGKQDPKMVSLVKETNFIAKLTSIRYSLLGVCPACAASYMIAAVVELLKQEKKYADHEAIEIVLEATAHALDVDLRVNLVEERESDTAEMLNDLIRRGPRDKMN